MGLHEKVLGCGINLFVLEDHLVIANSCCFNQEVLGDRVEVHDLKFSADSTATIGRIYLLPASSHVPTAICMSFAAVVLVQQKWQA